MLNNPKYRDKPLFITRKYPSIKAYKIGFNLSSINTNVISYTPIHLARHTFAVYALNEGLSMSVVSRLLGHGSTDITEKVYARFLPETLSTELNRLSGLSSFRL